MSKNRELLHFLHIGKTGGSAIKAVLKNHKHSGKYDLVLHNHQTAISEVPEGEKIFFCLRDPISRFVSGFYSRKRKGQPKYNQEWNKREKIVFESFETPNQIAELLFSASSDDKARGVEAMRSIPHFTRYKRWYGDMDYFKSRFDDILFVGFQESLDTDFEHLKSLLELPDILSLPSDDVVAHRNPMGIDKRISDKGLNALNKWYAEDYEFYNYCNEAFSSTD
ncbi:sulfotransferase family 2 domain-containing protein [Alteromonas sp. M12]|uniref:sulfotransferase family 2 domain-containing protein n=1 Tax=Alteromonas sp. M12 TaxID=3135644 RepID=UPI00319E80EE